MPSKNIVNYLERNQVNFNTIWHPAAFTAQEIAAAAHIHGRSLVKTVILKADDKLVMVIEPANMKVDIMALKDQLGVKKVELAHEYEFQDRFPECDTGAMPPLGDLFDIDVYVDDVIRQEENIVFNAGNHHELIKMRYKDFEKLVKPKHLHLH